jgi:hypothetical protein
MVCRLLLISLATIPLLGQQLRLPSVTPKSNALDRAIHSFVTKNANLPPALQPQKPLENNVPWYRQSPKRILIGRNSSRVCSIPLTNVGPSVEPNDLHMPRIAPRDIDRMPNIVPAPPCTNWPPE